MITKSQILALTGNLVLTFFLIFSAFIAGHLLSKSLRKDTIDDIVFRNANYLICISHYATDLKAIESYNLILDQNVYDQRAIDYINNILIILEDEVLLRNYCIENGSPFAI